MTRAELLEALSKLLPAQFEELIFLLDVPSKHLSGSNTAQSTRAIEVLRYLANESRLDELESHLGSSPGRSAAASPAPTPRRQAPPRARAAEGTKVRIVIEFTPGDMGPFERLWKHLKALQRTRDDLDLWSKNELLPSASTNDEIDERLAEADLLVVLVSSEFFASEDSYDRVERLVKEGRVRVIPVLISPCDWKGSILGRFQVLPRSEEPTSVWRNQDEAMHKVAKGIAQVVDHLSDVKR